MRIIPVIDVMGGVVVRAVGGRRHEYRPVESTLTTSTDPVEVARAMIEHTGADTLYVADLDGIVKGNPNPNLVEELTDSLHVSVWADVGPRSFDGLVRINQENSHRLITVLGSEWLNGPMDLYRGCMLLDGVIAFSIDIKGGQFLGDWQGWKSQGVRDPGDIVGVVNSAQRPGWTIKYILLELESVGEKRGPGTEEWCRQIRDAWPDIQLFTGGGVRDWDDVRRLEAAGADGVLVASAIHDGTLTFPRPLL